MKHNDWQKTSEAVSAIVELVEAVPGVISIHGQLADSLAIIVVLVKDDTARSAVRQLEYQLFDTSELPPIELRVRRVNTDEVALQQKALDTAYGRLSSLN